MPKAFNVSTVPDDEMRPWTISLKQAVALRQAGRDLDNVVAQTSASKTAGLRGSSSLDNIPQYEEFKDSFGNVWKPTPTTFELLLAQYSAGPATDSRTSSTPSQSKRPSKGPTPSQSRPDSTTDRNYDSSHVSFDQGIRDSSNNNSSNNNDNNNSSPYEFDIDIEKYRQHISRKEQKKMESLNFSRKKFPLSPIKYGSSKGPKVLNMSTGDYVKLKSKYVN